MSSITASSRRGTRRSVRALLGATVIAAAAVFGISAATPAAADSSGDLQANVPYSLPVTLPSAKSSPGVDSAAPYTPLVRSLIAQLEPDNPPTAAELANASLLLHDGPNGSCHNVGPVAAPTGTTPAIAPICWTDAQGVLNTSGPNARGSTGPMTLMGLGSTFDRSLGNAWGQTEGTESREFMVTGMFGPQTDLDRLPNWGRNLTTTGEDPYLSHELVAAQINGMQGTGAMSQMKHFAVYNGQNQNLNTDIQDQPLHENYLTPYEGGFLDGKAAATMCSYQLWRDTSPYLPPTVSSITTPSPYLMGAAPTTWPLNESHFSCEQPLILTYVLRNLWGSQAFVGSDYPATHSTSAILQGEDQEMPTQAGFFSATHTLTAGQQTDPTGDACADSTGAAVSCSTPGAVHVGGIPGPGCPSYGCALVDAVLNGTVPLAVFNQSLARILYQEERFGLLGCDNSTASCANPGGINGDRSGTANLPAGPTSGTPVLGTKNGDAAIVEKYSEEGATLLKNSGGTLPITSGDLNGGILVTGANANHTVADPTNEASTGFIGRDAINPLQQLKAFSGASSAFTFVPANDPDGQTVPASVLSTDASGATSGGLSLSVDGGPTSQDTHPIDHTTVNQNQLAPGHTYTWSGYLYVPTADTYSFALQQSPSLPTTMSCTQTGQNGTPASEPGQPVLTTCSPFTAANASQLNGSPDAVSFTLDGTKLNLNAVTANVYGATVPSSPTTAGSTEQGLISRTCATGTAALEPGTTNCTANPISLTPGYHSIQITVNNATGCLATPPAVAGGGLPAVAAVPAACGPASFRFAYSRTNGDIADAAAAAVGKRLAIVFVNDGVGATSATPNPAVPGTTISAPTQLSAASTNLINAVAAANPNTVVVLDTGNPVLMPWLPNVKSVLEMWFAGQEGGTSTARILLGLANPSGHSSLTWAANPTDTIWGYNETTPLYPGDTTGTHPERLNGNGGCAVIAGSGATCPTATGTVESEGIFNGYRFFDKEGIAPAIPFGFGLSYTTFKYSKLSVTPTPGAADVSFDVTNTGAVAGADVAQVYLGAGPDVAGVQQAVRSLRGFQRVELAPGQTEHVTIHLDKRSFEYWNEKTQSWVTNWGSRQLWVGDADAPANLPLSANVAPLKSLAAEASDLVTMVQGVGPGNSLNAKAKLIQAAAAAGQTGRVCSSLSAFENEVRAQTGKKLSTEVAAQLQEQANRIALAAGC